MPRQGCPKCGRGKADNWCHACTAALTDEALVRSRAETDNEEYIARKLAHFRAKQQEVQRAMGGEIERNSTNPGLAAMARGRAKRKAEQ